MPKGVLLGAGIDVGSNSIRLMVGQVQGQTLRVAAKERHTPRLGQGVEETGRLRADAITRALEVLARCRTMLDAHGVGNARACGTAALRMADNAADFLGQAEKTLGFPVEILTGEKEAQLCLRGALSSQFLRERGEPFLLIDVGGGSTELVLSPDGHSVSSVSSHAVGAIGLTEAFLPQGAASPQALAEMFAHLRRIFSPICRELTSAAAQPLPVGTGGTAAALAALDLGLLSYDAGRIHGHHLRRDRLQALFQRLVDLPLAERILLPGLGAGRADIIIGGAAVYHVVLELINRDFMIISDAGLLEGILWSVLTR